MLHVVRGVYGRHAWTCGGFFDPDVADNVREEIEETLLFGEVFVEEIPVYSSLEKWREREYPEEAAGAPGEG